MAAAFQLRPYRAEDEDAAIELWLRTWKLAYPSIDFEQRTTCTTSTLDYPVELL